MKVMFQFYAFSINNIYVLYSMYIYMSVIQTKLEDLKSRKDRLEGDMKSTAMQ
jgi:hypothetical protein